MSTFIYMVRHGDSPKTGEDERTRGLSPKGEADARKVTDLLRSEGIHAFYSSPYVRAVHTIAPLAEELGQEILLNEALKEKIWMEGNLPVPEDELYPALKRMYADGDYALPGGESNNECQARAVQALKEILRKHPGDKIVIGTHGLVMALMMGYFAEEYGLDFLLQTTKPDIYKMEFTEEKLTGVERVSVPGSDEQASKGVKY